MKLKNDITGSCTIITISRAISTSRSRPMAPTTRLMVVLAAAAPVPRRASSSVECRLAKKSRFWWTIVSNIRRWLSAMIALPICESFTACRYVALALTMKMKAVTRPMTKMPWKFLCT